MAWILSLLPFVPKIWRWWHGRPLKSRYTYLGFLFCILAGMMLMMLINDHQRQVHRLEHFLTATPGAK